jgi:hypothetical protein
MTQKERSRRHYLAHRGDYLERAKNQRKYEKLKLSPERLILQRIRASAKARKLDFDLEIEDIILPTVCPYLGCSMQFNEGSPQNNSYSVDRKDNSFGYIRGNIEIISFRANVMKQNASQEDQIKFAQEVLRRYAVSTI